MKDKSTERLLININYHLRTMRGMARSKSLMPYDLCQKIIFYSSAALDEIKEFRQPNKGGNEEVPPSKL